MNLTVRTLMFALLLSGCAETKHDRDDDAEEQTAPDDTTAPDGKSKDAATENKPPPLRDAGEVTERPETPRPDAQVSSDAPAAPKDAGLNRPDSTVIGPKDPFGDNNNFFDSDSGKLVGTGTTTLGAGTTFHFDASPQEVKVTMTVLGCSLTIPESKVEHTILGAGDVYVGDVLVVSAGKCVVTSVPAKP